MADMDLDDLDDGPSKAPSRPSRFAPKGSKFKPKPKTEPSQSLLPSASESGESLPAPKKEELAVKPETKPGHTNDVVEMDFDVKPAVKDQEEGDSMELPAAEAENGAEDEVVREIDVYFAPSVDSKTRLYVLQYPLRPIWRPYELDDRCEEVRVKPGSTEVEIDLSVDVNSKNYDSEADPRVQMTKQTLTSSWKPPRVSGYAVGVLTGNKLHLSPVQAVVQLRPSMQHLGSRDSGRTVEPSSFDNKVKLEEPEAGKTSSSKKQSKPSEQSQLAGNKEESWIPLKYHSASSEMALKCLQRMMSRQEGSQIEFSMSSYDYLNSLCPGTSSDSFSSKGPPIRFLLTLPLKERFRTWFLEGPSFHRFSALKHLAPDNSVEEVLEILQEYARLVQGLWTPKSHLVYGTDSGPEVIARDFVLRKFSKSVTMKKKEIPRQVQIANHVKEILKSLAVEREDFFNDWKLKELPDLSFIKSYPSIVEKQEREWERLEEKLSRVLPDTKPAPTKKLNTTNNPSTSKSSGKVVSRAPKGGAAMPEEVRDAVTKALQKLFKTVKICSFQQISQLLRDMAVSESARSTGFAREAVTAANSIDAYPDELQAIINQIAVNIHGICVPKSSPDCPQYDSFRKVVIDLFIAQGPNARLRKASITEAARMELKREPSTIEYDKVVKELCLSQGSGWTLKTGGGNPKH
ncbi:SIN-like family protein [Striga hermonthica]|uniref:SIN-like family protein n=1 Tax=Striga hermonthica TaxID=68872 RepID=A0A9N7R9D7_STRHE|nr:SIN-like family protein [Striga hermonthica]